MRLPSEVRRVASVVLMLLALALTAGAALAQDVYVDVVINGHLLAGGGLIHGDRTYVDLRDVARVLDGRFVYDAQLNIAFIHTGRYASLFRNTLARQNPKIAEFGEIMMFQPGQGVYYGVNGPHLSVATTPAGVVTAFMVVFPADVVEPKPWFDQQGGEPIEVLTLDSAFTQHVYVINRSLIHPASTTHIAFNGSPLGVRDDAIMWRGGRLFVRLRDLAEASGGGVGWNVENRVASAKVVPGPDLTYDRLAFLNTYMNRDYTQLSEFVPGKGYRRGPDGPGIDIGLDGDGLVAWFGVAYPEGTVEWQRWFDQEEGRPETFPDGMSGYSHSIYLVSPGSIEP